MLLATGLAIVIAYLVLSINVYLEAYAFKVFRLGHAHFGPTEARAGLFAVNALLAAGVGLQFRLNDVGLTVFDVVGLGIAGAMAAALAVRAARNLRHLAIEEPSARAAVRRAS
jgi:hypothetical protein